MWLPNQLASRPTFDTPTNPPVAVFHTLPGDDGLDRRGRAGLDLHVEVERLLPHRHQEDRVAALAEVLLGDLQLDRLVGVLQRAEQRRRRLAHLEVDRSVLDLDDDVVVEPAVEAR